MEPLRSTLADSGVFASDGSMQAKWPRFSGLILMTVVGGYAGATLWVGSGGWQVALTSISLYDLLIIVGLVSTGVLLRASRWHCYIRLLQWNVPLLKSISAFVAGFALTATPAKSGELAKVALLRSQHKISLSQGAGVLLIERLGDLFAVIVFAVVGLTIFVDLSRFVLASLVVFGAVALAIANSQALLARAQAIRQLRNPSLRLLNMLDAVALLMRPIPLLAGGCVALAAWACEALAFHYLLGRLGIQSSLSISFSIYGLSTLAGALSMLPGGLGSMEAVMTLLLTRVAAPTSTAAVAVVIFRLCTLWLFSLIGAIFITGWMIFVARQRQPNLLAEAQ